MHPGTESSKTQKIKNLSKITSAQFSIGDSFLPLKLLPPEAICVDDPLSH